MDVRSYNVGSSNYCNFKHQPWDVWISWKLNPFEADICKRILRTKEEPGMTIEESKRLDKKKIIHICKELLRQKEDGIKWDIQVYNIKLKEIEIIEITDLAKEYNLTVYDCEILACLKDGLYDNIINICEKQLSK